ncbi:MAG TPA: hypothetical protein VH044_09210 [Polyangiaceae bacterium]|nr:hypothetical protein [Polyangiaceae bacterium]
MTDPHLVWAKGGEARIVRVSGEAITLRSTVPSPPGSRIEGLLAGEPPSPLRVKVHASRRQPEGDFVLEGRLLDITRDLRARLEALAAPIEGGTVGRVS